MQVKWKYNDSVMGQSLTIDIMERVCYIIRKLFFFHNIILIKCLPLEAIGIGTQQNYVSQMNDSSSLKRNCYTKWHFSGQIKYYQAVGKTPLPFIQTPDIHVHIMVSVVGKVPLPFIQTPDIHVHVTVSVMGKTPHPYMNSWHTCTCNCFIIRTHFI